MPRFFVVFSICLLALTTAAPAQAQDHLAFSLGYYDVNDHADAVDLRAEYRWQKPLIGHVRPWAGIEGTSDGAFFGLGGLLMDVKLNDHLYLTPSFGAGIYHSGSGKDLGSAIEFRSQLECGYQFAGGHRLSLGFSHISNGGLNDNNPGTEILSLYYYVPVSW